MLHSIQPQDYQSEIFADFDKRWALLTAGTPDSFNSMTVSWGCLGELWGKSVVFVFVRPQRFTYKFCEKSDRFTLSMMPDGYKKELGVFGSQSGRDTDKYTVTGLHTAQSGNDIYCAEAKTVFICKKIAVFDWKPDMILDKSVLPDCYPNRDFHRVYVGEIETLLKSEPHSSHRFPHRR